MVEMKGHQKVDWLADQMVVKWDMQVGQWKELRLVNLVVGPMVEWSGQHLAEKLECALAARLVDGKVVLMVALTVHWLVPLLVDE